MLVIVACPSCWCAAEPRASFDPARCPPRLIQCTCQSRGSWAVARSSRGTCDERRPAISQLLQAAAHPLTHPKSAQERTSGCLVTRRAASASAEPASAAAVCRSCATVTGLSLQRSVAAGGQPVGRVCGSLVGDVLDAALCGAFQQPRPRRYGHTALLQGNRRGAGSVTRGTLQQGGVRPAPGAPGQGGGAGGRRGGAAGALTSSGYHTPGWAAPSRTACANAAVAVPTHLHRPESAVRAHIREPQTAARPTRRLGLRTRVPCHHALGGMFEGRGSLGEALVGVKGGGAHAVGAVEVDAHGARFPHALVHRAHQRLAQRGQVRHAPTVVQETLHSHSQRRAGTETAATSSNMVPLRRGLNLHTASRQEQAWATPCNGRTWAEP